MSAQIQPYSPMPSAPATVRDLVCAFLEDRLLGCQAEGKSLAAFKNLRCDLQTGGETHPTSLATFAGDTPVGELTGQTLTRWLLANPTWKSIHKRKGVLAGVRAMYTWAWRAFGLVCPIRAWPSLPKHGETRREATVPEYVKLMRHGTPALRRALYFLFNTGCRPLELMQLTWTDVIFEDGVVDTWHNKTLRATGESRVFGLEPRLLRFLKNLHRRRPPFTDFVFLNNEGQPWKEKVLGKHLRRTCRRLKMDEASEAAGQKPLTAYCFRHHYITDADEAGVDALHISYQSGHSNTRMIEQVYSKARRKRRNAQRVSHEIAAKRRRLRKNPDQGKLF